MINHTMLRLARTVRADFLREHIVHDDHKVHACQANLTVPGNLALTDTYKYDYHLVVEMRRGLPGLITPKRCIGFTYSDVKHTLCILTNLFGDLLCHLQLKAEFY